MSVLWETATVGRMQLTHRLALAPMTRSRALARWHARPARRRSTTGSAPSLGLLISEGVQPSDDGQGYLNTPGIYRSAHVEGWREVADAVHAEGGHLVLQLMHVGRMSHPDNTPHHRHADRAVRDRARRGDVHADADVSRSRSRAR